MRSRLGYDVHGSLGYEMFDRYVVDIDYPARTITLREPKDFVYEGGGTVLPITLTGRVPATNASIVTRTKGTIDARLEIDLGLANYAVRLASGIVKAHDLDHDTVGVTGVFGVGVGGVIEGQLLRMSQLRLGNLSAGSTRRLTLRRGDRIITVALPLTTIF